MIENGIHFGAANGDVLLIKKILSENKKLANDVNYYGMTPLHAAAFHGHVEVTSVLLEHGADPNHPSSGSKYTFPLHLAVTRLHRPIIELLLVKGHADPAFKDYLGQTVIDIARGISIESDSEAKDPEINTQMVLFIKECIGKGAYNNDTKKKFSFESKRDSEGYKNNKKQKKKKVVVVEGGNSFSDNEIENFEETNGQNLEEERESPVMKHLIKSDLM